MKKKAFVLFLLVLCLGCSFILTIAETEPEKWHDAKSHNRWTELMLFGNPSYTYTNLPEIRLRVEQLEDALLLCIDQCNGYYKDKLEKLCFIQGVPKDLTAINFFAGNLKKETGHRAFTHLGWNHTYTDQKSHPEVRKQILTSVLEYVFQFKKHFSTEKANRICDGMGCLLYNTHIIADRYHSTSYHGARSTLLLADASSQTETVIHDLLECIQTIFPDIHRSHELIKSLQLIEEEIITERRKNPTDDGLMQVDRTYAVKMKDLLANYLPGLLQKQAWFTQAFPSNWNNN